MANKWVYMFSEGDMTMRNLLGGKGCLLYTSLFPDTTYANVSGGDPLHIPELTYEEYLDFHRRYYHPCNSYIYLYGDMDVAEKLAWMDEAYLGKRCV